MRELSFTLPMDPMPTPRPRTRVIAMPGRKPIATIYSPKEYQLWQAEAAKHLKKVEAITFDGPVLVDIFVEAPRPKTTKLPAPKADVDNYAKGVLDAITKDGRFWADDSQVQTLYVTKLWGLEGRIGVTIRSL